MKYRIELKTDNDYDTFGCLTGGLVLELSRFEL